MKVGDLVKLIDAPYQRGSNRPDLDYARIGILTQFTCHGNDGPLASGHVRWAGNFDWDLEYAEDLEVINASR